MITAKFLWSTVLPNNGLLTGSCITCRGSLNSNESLTPAVCRSVSPIEPLPPSRLKAPIARIPLKPNTQSSGIPLRASAISSPTSGLSPASSCSRIPISKSQDDLLKNVHLRSTNKASNASKSRPTSYRNSINSPRNSKLMSRNSVEVLSYNEVQKGSICSQGESGVPRKFYGQFPSQKDNRTGSGSRIAKNPDVGASRKVASRIPGPSAGLARTNNSKFSPSSSSTSSTTSYAASTSPSFSYSSSSGSDAGSPRSGLVQPMINETKKPVVLRSLENEPRSPSKTTFLKSEAEKVLTEQRLLGKVPPKAKFREDDEISIGDPAESGNEEIMESPSKAAGNPEAPTRTDTIDMCQGSQEVKHRLSDIPAASRLLEEARRTNSLPLNTVPIPLPKTQSDKFFQRLSNLRRSFNTTDYRRLGGKIRPHINRRNSPFFEGIPPDSRRPGKSLRTPVHTSALVVPPLLPLYRPPARKYPGCAPAPASHGTKLKRSLSFSDAQVIAQSVTDSDPKLIHELYPGFPFSEPIYKVIDRAKTVRLSIDSKTLNKEKEQLNNDITDDSSRSVENLDASNSSTVVNIPDSPPGKCDKIISVRIAQRLVKS